MDTLIPLLAEIDALRALPLKDCEPPLVFRPIEVCVPGLHERSVAELSELIASRAVSPEGAYFICAQAAKTDVSRAAAAQRR